MGFSAESQAGRLMITDLTLRDGHQSLFATRMRTGDLTAIARDMDSVGFWSLEVWGGATFDVMTRFLNEDPWERVRALKALMPNSRLQMLLRGQNLVGYRNYADDVVEAFVQHASRCGIDVFRVFDALNDERNFITAFKAIRATGKHIQGAVCYSLTEPRLGGPVYNLDYYVAKARIIEGMGADSLCIKDMAGLLAPADAYELVGTLKQELRIPVWVHSHFTSGMASMTLLKAVEAGADGIDTCLAPFSYRTSHPAVEPMVAALRGERRATGLSLEQLLKLDEYFEQVAPKYRDFLDTTKLSIVDTGVLSHQIPGGMFSNMVAQLKQAGALDRLADVYAELPRTRKELGYPPLVTPTSQIVGIQAVQNVLFGRYQMISREVKDYLYGLYGRPPAPVDPEVQRLALRGYERGEEPISGRAADVLKPELEAAGEATRGLARDIGDVLCYALYPTTGLRFLKWKYGLELPPAEASPKTLEEVKREDDLVAKARRGQLVEAGSFQAARRTAPERTFAVHVGGECYRVDVDPEAGRPAGVGAGDRVAPVSGVESAATGAGTAGAGMAAGPAPVTSGDVSLVAPMPGLVIRYLVSGGDEVKRGAPVLVFEAMKMENTISATVSGRIKSLPFKPGDAAERGAILAAIEPAAHPHLERS